MVLVKNPDQVAVLEESRAPPSEQLSPFRRLTVNLSNCHSWMGDHAREIGINHGDVQNALKISLQRTIRVPDNRDTNTLPPSLGVFPLYKVQDFAKAMPEDMAQKGGLFFPMYQREAMWINFQGSTPFALKVYVGGVNAVSGLPMTDNEKTREKRLKMVRAGKPVQDYMVIPGQKWLDGIVSEDGKIRQFIAKPKGSGYSVEAQVTGEETVGGIQIEIIPAKRGVPAELDIRYEDKEKKVITRTLNFAEHNLTDQSTWLDLKAALQEMFGISTGEQRILPNSQAPGESLKIDDNTKLGTSYFNPNLVLHLTHQFITRQTCKMLGASPQTTNALFSAHSPAAMMLSGAPMSNYLPSPSALFSVNSPSCAPAPRAAPNPLLRARTRNHHQAYDASPALERKPTTELFGAPAVKEMGLAAGGLIQQVIAPDRYRASMWDVEASIMLNVQILGSESFCQVTGLPPPPTPVDAQTYAQHGYPFFEVWGEEKTGISGDFGEVKSAAQIDAERAAGRGEAHREEDSVPQRVLTIGKFHSTFRPVDFLKQELEGLKLDGE